MNKNKLKQFLHLLAGVLLLWHGFTAFEKEHQFHTMLFLTVSLVVLIAAGLQQWITKQYQRADGYLFMLEGIVVFYSAMYYKLTGSPLLFILNLFVALILLSKGLNIVKLSKQKRRYKKHSRQSVPAR